MNDIFFDDWIGLQRAAIIGALAYIVLVVFLRLSGNRTLSKLNAFDLVVTVALGSTLATVVLNKSVALAEGAVAFGLLILLQFLVTWTSVRFGWIRHVVTGDPRLLVYRGQLLSDPMKKARITEGEILAAVRGSGLLDLQAVEAVVLETDGSVSVVEAEDRNHVESCSLRDVKGWNGLVANGTSGQPPSKDHDQAPQDLQ